MEKKLPTVIKSIQYLLDKASLAPEVRELAVQIIAGTDDPIKGIHHWVRSNLAYIDDPVVNGKNVEQFTSPVRLINDYRAGKSIGEDCDSHAILATALYQSIGIPARVVLVGYNGDVPEHAYTQAWSEKLNTWLDVDTTTDYPIGWKLPYKSIIIV